MSQALFAVTLLAALGAGLVAGFFYAFSVTVMWALARRPAAEAIGAMQQINVTVLNPWFFGAFFGTGVLCLVLVAAALTRGSALLAIGGLLYLAGTILVTALANVPRNEALKRLAPSSAEAAAYWNDYVKTWTRWNHVRAAAALAAAAAFTLALARTA